MIKSLFNKKEKIISFSFINTLFSSLISKKEVDFLRVDINEIALLCNKADVKKIKAEDLIFLTSNFNLNMPLFIDIPPLLLYGSNPVREIIDFFNSSNCCGLSIDLKYTEINIIKKLKFENIPVIGYIDDKKEKFEKIKDYALEFESQGGDLIILNNFEDSFIENISSLLSIPLISNNNCKCDGIYSRTTDLLGFNGKEKQILNFSELFSDGINDYVYKIKK